MLRDRLIGLRERAQPQGDGLCGPFWLVVAAQALLGSSVTQEDVARLAGTREGGAPVLPPGEPSSPPDVDLPTGPAEQAGTSAHGLVEAAISLGLWAHPVRGVDVQVADLRAVLVWAAGVPVVVLANLQTGLLAESPWSAGHVVCLLGLDGDHVLVGDSYPTLGVHRQSLGSVIAALHRDDEPAEGGLLVLGAEPLDTALPRGLWDNGTPLR